MEVDFVLRSREDTLAWGRALGRLLQAGDLIALIGDLGAGKTTLTQGIAQGMGIADRVTSPTFTLVQEYGGAISLFHFDPYRLEHPEDALEFGFQDYLERAAVIVVEWADKIAALLPVERLTLTLREEEESGEEGEKRRKGEKENSAFEDEAARLLAVAATGPRYKQLLEELLRAPEIAALRPS